MVGAGGGARACVVRNEMDNHERIECAGIDESDVCGLQPTQDCIICWGARATHMYTRVRAMKFKGVNGCSKTSNRVDA